MINEPTALAGADKDAKVAAVDATETAFEALAAAKRQKSRVEILAERTAYSSTFALPSGERETEFGAPFRVQRDGQWFPFDASLVATDGDVSLPVVSVGEKLARVKQRPAGSTDPSPQSGAAAVGGLTLGQAVGPKLAKSLREEQRARQREGSRFGAARVFSPRVSEVPVRIARGGADSDETPLGEIETTQGASLAVFWPEDLPRAEVDGPRASYKLSSTEELQVTAVTQGFNAHVVLAERPALAGGPPVYRFPIEVDGVRLVRTEDGGYAALNAAGRALFRIAPTVAWDSSPPTEENPDGPNTVPIESQLVSDEQGRAVLEVRPSADWLARAQCPCTIDPNFTFTGAPLYDTLIREAAPTTSYGSVATVHTGTKDATTNRQRAYIAFYTPILIGRKINSATLQVRNTNSNTCTATGVSVYPASSLWDNATTWNTRPGHYTTTTYKSSASFNHGFSSSCPAAHQSFNVTPTVTAWINGTLSDYGFAVIADNETATSGFKAFCSFNLSGSTGCNQAAWTPKLTVIWNTVPALVQNTSMSPAAACSTAETGQPWVDTTTPALRGTANDLDEEPTRINYEVWPVTGTPATVVGSSPQYLPPGSLHEWSVPAGNLADGRAYKWRAYGFDGADASAMASDWCNFRVDLTAPTAPTISSTDYPAGQWSHGAGTAGTFTITPGSDPVPSGGAASGTSGILWSLDDPTPSTTVTLNGSGGIDPITVTPKTDGKHTLYVATVDAARNISPVTAHEFFVGHGAVTSPDDGDRTARRFFLASQVQDALAVTFQYRRGETDNWHDIGVGTAVPVAAGLTAPIEWDAAATVSGDGKVDLRTLFIGGASDGLGSAPISVTIDRLASDAATTQVGPGTLNLLTGDYLLSATDASYWGISITRTARSRNPQAGDHVTGIVAPFGPQWAAGGISEDAGTDFTSLTVTTAKSIEIARSDATKVQFTLTDDTVGGDPLWQPEVGSEQYTLTGDSTGYLLASTDGTRVRFAPSGTTGLFTVASVTTPGAGNTTLHHFGPDGAGKLRLERIIAPNASMDIEDCNVAGEPPIGCRRLDLTYTASSVPPPEGSALGAYPGRVAGVSLWVTDPATGVVDDQQVAAYAYDSAGRLREAWDSRISPNLKAGYTYDNDGRVLSLTPPGELAHTFAYGTVGTDTNTGRLFSLTRGALDDGKSETVWNVIYDVPLTTSGTAAANGPHNLDPATVATWGQSVAPVDATAVLPPDAGFTGDHYGGRSSAGWTRATITYLDIEGRRVSEAIPGGGISATGYDEFGNTVRELSVNNRARALRAATDPELITLGLADLSTAQRADLLAETSLYNGTGQRLLQQYGPIRQVILPDSGGNPGAPVLAREHTVNTFDQGRPTDGTATVADQITESKTGARVIGADSDVDVRTIRTYFDWAKGKPNKVVQDEGGLAITTVTDYDAQARPIRTDMPSAFAAGRTDGADTTYTTYYADGAPGDCDSVDLIGLIFDGMVCQTTPAGAISGGGSNPTQRMTTRTTYTELGLVDQVIETANSVTRTTDTTYDGAGRPTLQTVTGGLGTAVPTVATTYSTTTGRVLTTVDTSVSPNPTITRTYDTLGRLTSYIDADGGKTETTYTWLDQVKTTRQFSNPANPAVPVITTYAYSTDRQLLTTLVDPLAGTFTATYDPAGQLITQGMPGGVTMTQAEDPTGSWLKRTYTGNGTPLTGVLMTETVTENVHDQWRTRVRGDNLTFGPSQRHNYDKIGRLVQTLDITGTASGAGQECARRDYGFTGHAGLNTNRTSYAETLAAGSCPAAPGTAVTSTYDTADRIVNAGYVYDAHGRTTTAPLPAGTASIDYHVNDMVRRQTIGNNRQTWTLDPGLRLRSWTTETKPAATWNLTGSKTNHYAGDAGGADSPAWINETTSTVTRNVAGINGELAAYTDAATANVFWLQLPTLHGDVGQVIHFTSATTSDQAYPLDNTEYGAKKPGTTGPAYGRYAWLGAKQRSIETVGQSLILMGVRLYNPATGRFLTVDPIVGGNANAYEYCIADPINCFDLDGRWGWKKTFKVVRFLGQAAVVTVAIGAFCGATAGLGCVIGVAAVGGGLFGASNYLMDNRGRYSGRGLYGATWRGAVFGGVSRGTMSWMSYGRFYSGFHYVSHVRRQLWRPGTTAY